MMLATAPRIMGATPVVARKKPNSTQTTACRNFRPAYRCSTQTVMPSTTTSDKVTAISSHPFLAGPVTRPGGRSGQAGLPADVARRGRTAAGHSENAAGQRGHERRLVRQALLVVAADSGAHRGEQDQPGERDAEDCEDEHGQHQRSPPGWFTPARTTVTPA